MNWKYIFLLLLIIVLIIYLVFYPLQFDFYENSKAKNIADFIFIPILSYPFIYDLYWNIQKGETKWKKYSLDFIKNFAVVAIFYFFVLRGFFACGVIFGNTIFGEKEKVKINGIITNKKDIIGSGKFIGKYELIVEQNGIKYIFDSNHLAIKDLNVGDNFEVEMKKGIFNILYK